jgi:homoserine kinase type II
MPNPVVLSKRFIDLLGEEFSVGPIALTETRPPGPYSHYLLETKKGRFIVQVEEAKSEFEIKQEMELLLFLRHQGFPCPQPVSTRTGKYLIDYEGNSVSLYKSITGQSLPLGSLNLLQLENAGKILGELHVIGKGFKKAGENRFSFETMSSTYQQIRKFLPPHLRAMVRVLDDEFGYMKNYADSNLVKGLIYGNRFPESLRFKCEKVVCVVGFASACRSKILYDVANAVNAFCFGEDRYHLDRFESFMNGYEAVRPLSLPEWDSFPNELRFSALHHMVRGLRDFFMRRGEDRARVERDFRESFQRLLILRRERDGGMEDLLMTMATGYDYRRYQKVKGTRLKERIGTH